MWREESIWKVQEGRVFGEGFWIVDIEDGARGCIRGKKERQCIALQNHPATGVDEHSVVAHRSDQTTSDKVSIRWSSINVN